MLTLPSALKYLHEHGYVISEKRLKSISGTLVPVTMTGGSHRRYKKSDLLRFLKDQLIHLFWIKSAKYKLSAVSHIENFSYLPYKKLRPLIITAQSDIQFVLNLYESIEKCDGKVLLVLPHAFSRLEPELFSLVSNYINELGGDVLIN